MRRPVELSRKTALKPIKVLILFRFILADIRGYKFFRAAAS